MGCNGKTAKQIANMQKKAGGEQKITAKTIASVVDKQVNERIKTLQKEEETAEQTADSVRAVIQSVVQEMAGQKAGKKKVTISEPTTAAAATATNNFLMRIVDSARNKRS